MFQINDGAEMYRPIPPPEGIGLHNGILLIRLLCIDNVQVVKRARSSLDAESMLNTPRIYTPRDGASSTIVMPTHHESQRRGSDVSGEEADQAA